MDIDEKLSDLLDGSLDSNSEDILFTKLASDKELRSEFKQSLSMEMGMQQEALKLVPSRDLSNKVFTQLGIGAAIGGAASQSTSWLSGKMGLFLSSIAGAVITSMIFWGSGALDKGETQASNQMTQANYAPIIIEIPKEPVRQETVKAERYNQNTIYTPKPTPVVSQESSINESDLTEEASVMENNYEPKNIASRNYINSHDNNTIKLEFPVTDNMTQKSFIPTQKTELPSSQSNFLEGWSLRFHKSYDQSFYSNRDVSTLGNANTEFRNLSFSIQNKFRSWWRIGFEVKQEQIFQQFTGSEEILNLDFQNEMVDVEYYQLPTLTSFTLQNHFDILSYKNIDLYSGVDLGFNRAMALWRIPVGVRIPIYSSYLIDLGYNFNGYHFTHDGANFANFKSSFYGGIILEF